MVTDYGGWVAGIQREREAKQRAESDEIALQTSRMIYATALSAMGSKERSDEDLAALAAAAIKQGTVFAQAWRERNGDSVRGEPRATDGL